MYTQPASRSLKMVVQLNEILTRTCPFYVDVLVNILESLKVLQTCSPNIIKNFVLKSSYITLSPVQTVLSDFNLVIFMEVCVILIQTKQSSLKGCVWVCVIEFNLSS